MTYKELYDKALWDLEHNRITLGEFEEVTEPLNKEIPKEEQIDGDLITEIDKLPRIKVGNSNSPTVKYCIDEVLLYDLLDRYKAEKTAEWITKWDEEEREERHYCTNCNKYQLFQTEFCSHCGAKMKEGDTE